MTVGGSAMSLQQQQQQQLLQSINSLAAAV